MGFFDWLKQDLGIVKRATRYLRPRIMAYWWDGGMPVGRELKNLSTTGAFLDTAERWYPGTIITLTLQQQRDDTGTDGRVCSISVPCKVVRDGSDGVGVSFLFRGKEDRKALEEFVRTAAAGGPLRGAASGQALVEFALMVPLLFLLIFSAVNFGGFIYAWITVANAARAAANYAALGGASARLPTPAHVSNITALIQNETSSLPGTTPTVTVCENDNGTAYKLRTATACPAGVTAPPKDPETIGGVGTASYTTVAVDVTYTYTPFIGGFSFTNLGISLAGLPTTIHRRTIMRVLN